MRTFPFTLLLTLTLAAPAAFAADPTPSLSATFELESEDLPAAFEAELNATIQAKFTTLAEHHELRSPPAQSEPPDLLVRARIWQPEPDVLLIRSSVHFEGQEIAAVDEDVCMSCTLEEVADRSLLALPDAVEHARSARAEAAPPPVQVSEPASQDPPPLRPGAPRVGPVGYAGIGAGILGVAAVVTGAAFLHRGVVRDSSVIGPWTYLTDYRPTGVGLVAGGVAGVVLGYALMAVDMSVLRDRRGRLSGLSVVIKDGVGVALRGRF